MNAHALRLWVMLLSFATWGPACKKKDTMAPIVIGDQSTHGDDIVAGGVAPPWQNGVVARLENGSQLIWLNEADRPGFDLRILFPTRIPDAPDVRAAPSIVVFSALEKQLRARIRHTDLHFERRDRPGRIEFAIHGRREDFASASLLLAQSFGAKPNKDLLGAAHGRWVATDAPDPVQETTLRHTERVLQLPPLSLGSLPQDFAALDDDALANAWDFLLDPKLATVLVHAAPPDESSDRALGQFAKRWRRSFWQRGAASEPLTALRISLPTANHENEVANALRSTAMKRADINASKKPASRPTWIATRRLELPDLKQKAIAQLAQRFLQYEHDIRLVMHGSVGVWQLRVTLPNDAKAASKALRQQLGELEERMSERFSIERARQATRTWLGARLVETSLKGEDWTRLWSDAFDLATSNDKVPASLQQHGDLMLKLSEDEVKAWLAQEVHPRSAKAVWISELVDDDVEILKALNDARTQGPPDDRK